MTDRNAGWLKSGFFKCPVCGEEFYMPPYITEWAYKVKRRGQNKPCCSYSCMQKESKNEPLKGEHYLKNKNRKVIK